MNVKTRYGNSKELLELQSKLNPEQKKFVDYLMENSCCLLEFLEEMETNRQIKTLLNYLQFIAN